MEEDAYNIGIGGQQRLRQACTPPSLLRSAVQTQYLEKEEASLSEKTPQFLLNGCAGALEESQVCHVSNIFPRVTIFR